MRWLQIVPIAVAITITGGRALHLPGGVGHIDETHDHSHGHWHGDVYHEHHHTHDEPVTEPLEEHAQVPHDHHHDLTNLPDEDPITQALIANTARRDQWKPIRSFVIALSTIAVAATELNKAPPTPPPRSRAGPDRLELVALRSIKLQV
jgi:hypothetical protein